MHDKYSKCPDCGRKSVFFRSMPRGEDNYQCRYKSCDFFFFTSSNSRIDLDNEDRWKAVQPDFDKDLQVEEVTPVQDITAPEEDW